MAGIYVHIPFCRKACTYCDFHFSTNLSRKAEMVEAISREASLRKDFFATKKPLDTLYFGGGTPSLLQKEDWETLLSNLHHEFDFKEGFEFTVECNPDDLTQENLLTLRETGVNRLSIGVQSFRDEDLQLMNRSHNAGQARNSILWAREAGFENLTADLIYGMPNMDLNTWQENVETMLSLGVNHISAYALTVEEKTALSYQVEKGAVQIPEDETYEEHYFLLIDLLKAAGFEQYELSNFALPGHLSKHNSSYWHGEPYLGLGPSAHSFQGNTRLWNLANNAHYIQKIQKDELPAESSEELSAKDQVNEYLLTHLRLSQGIDLNELQEKHGHDLMKASRPEIEVYQEEGLMVREGPNLRLTRSGKMLSNAIISELFLD